MSAAGNSAHLAILPVGHIPTMYTGELLPSRQPPLPFLLAALVVVVFTAALAVFRAALTATLDRQPMLARHLVVGDAVATFTK